tara:strand:- start:324 stop:719 length:396 start_codon:yes stop_codon:yes gene_type:complete
MSQEIKDRLKTTSEACLKCYEAWVENDKDLKVREALQDAIHELRKVSSRLEIELAVSEREQMAQKPIPIPPHRDARNRNRNKGKNDQGGNNDDEGRGNAPQPQQQNNAPNVERKPQRRRAPSKKAAEGGGE